MVCMVNACMWRLLASGECQRPAQRIFGLHGYRTTQSCDTLLIDAPLATADQVRGSELFSCDTAVCDEDEELSVGLLSSQRASLWFAAQGGRGSASAALPASRCCSGVRE